MIQEFSPAAIYTALYQTANAYPTLTKIEIVGHSLCGLPLVALFCGKNPDKGPYLLLTGAHHGSEAITAGLLAAFANAYCRALAEDQTVAGLSLSLLAGRRTLVILPLVNPDGCTLANCGHLPAFAGNQAPAAGAQAGETVPLSHEALVSLNNGSSDFTHWQANARGVDLNHNYDAGFEAYRTLPRAVLRPGPTRFPGDHPESEPESAAVAALARRLMAWQSMPAGAARGTDAGAGAPTIAPAPPETGAAETAGAGAENTGAASAKNTTTAGAAACGAGAKATTESAVACGAGAKTANTGAASAGGLVAALAFHTQGEVIYYHASRKTRPGALRLAALTGYTPIGSWEENDPAGYGGFSDWLSLCGVPAFTLECGRGQNPLPFAILPSLYASLCPALLHLPLLF